MEVFPLELMRQDTEGGHVWDTPFRAAARLGMKACLRLKQSIANARTGMRWPQAIFYLTYSHKGI
jgi:hypothetical protein